MYYRGYIKIYKLEPLLVPHVWCEIHPHLPPPHDFIVHVVNKQTNKQTGKKINTDYNKITQNSQDISHSQIHNVDHRNRPCKSYGATRHSPLGQEVLRWSVGIHLGSSTGLAERPPCLVWPALLFLTVSSSILRSSLLIQPPISTHGIVLTDLPRFDITPQGQQIHISDSASPLEPKSSRHPCFRVASPEALIELQKKIWTFYESEEAGEARPREADKPGEVDSGESFTCFFFGQRGKWVWVLGWREGARKNRTYESLVVTDLFRSERSWISH